MKEVCIKLAAEAVIAERDRLIAAGVCSMIKNAIIYRISANLPDLPALEEGLQKAAFQPCTPTQENREGWVPPGRSPRRTGQSVGGQMDAALSH